MKSFPALARMPPPPWMLALAFVGLAAVPLLLAAHGQARERGAVAELAVGAGLLALAMLLMQFISSGRYEKVSGRAGIDATMRFHQLTAYGVLALAVLHPVFFLWPDTLQDLGRVPGMLAMMAGAPPLRSGVIALLLLAALVPMGMLRSRLPLRYEGWRILHALLAVGAGGASLHHALSVGATAAHPGLSGSGRCWGRRRWDRWRMSISSSRPCLPGVPTG